MLVSKNEQPAKMTADRALGPFDLTGEMAMVTGGNGGIGLGMARGLAQAGAAGGDRRARQRGTKMMVKAIGIHPIGADACSVLTIGGIGEKHPVATIRFKLSRLSAEKTAGFAQRSKTRR